MSPKCPLFRDSYHIEFTFRVSIGMFLQRFVIKKLVARTGKGTSNVGKAEIKIIVVILYFTLMGIMGLMSISFYEFSNIKEHLVESFLCENGSQECNNQKLATFNTFAVLSVVATSLFTFAPVVAVLFSLDLKLCRKTLRKAFS